jgi:hypothetical protein
MLPHFIFMKGPSEAFWQKIIHFFSLAYFFVCLCTLTNRWCYNLISGQAWLWKSYYIMLLWTLIPDISLFLWLILCVPFSNRIGFFAVLVSFITVYPETTQIFCGWHHHDVSNLFVDSTHTSKKFGYKRVKFGNRLLMPLHVKSIMLVLYLYCYLEVHFT